VPSETPSNTKRWPLQTWLGISAAAKPKVYEQILADSDFKSLSYWLEIIFSAGIATLGLIENSPAVIIGAMLISPLMGPIMATGLALAAGDLYLGIRALTNLLASVALSIAFSGLVVWLVPFHSATSEIISRTTPNLLDLAIALFSGLAGSVVVCRGREDGVTAIPGVAIAVALMPPLGVMGFGLGSGVNLEIIGGAGLLFLTNLVAIVASAFLVFLLVGMSAPEVQSAVTASRGGAHPSGKPSSGVFARILAAGAKLHWRAAMILILLASIAIPLQRALLQVASETSAREIVEGDLRRLVPPGAVVSQQVTVGKDEIVIRLISTRRVPGSKMAQVREDLKLRTGRDIDLSVDAIATGSALAALVAHLTRSSSPAAEDHKANQPRQELLDEVREAIQQIWPLSDAPIQGFDVVTGTTGTTIDVRYQARNALDDVSIHLLLHSLRSKLGMPDLILNAERVQPSPAGNRSSVLSGKP
jgi:uncharacterized hydrophobic protein (TIGR00271 family)